MDALTPREFQQLNSNLAVVADQVNEFVAAHRRVSVSGDQVGALIHTTDLVVHAGYDCDDLVRLLAFAVSRLAAVPVPVTRTSVTCPVCTHHVLVDGGLVGFHYNSERVRCSGVGRTVDGAR